MTEILGLNWYIISGVVTLVLSTILIVYGLQSNINSKSLFNVSRLLALLSVAGIWYFGNINTKKTSLEIEQNKKETAQAVEKTKNLELDISTAKKETEEAKLKTEEIRLEVERANVAAQKANAEAERAKLEREKIIKQTRLLEKQNAELKIESDRVKSFRIKLLLGVNDNRVFNNYGIHSVQGVVGYVNLMINPSKVNYKFIASQPYSLQQADNGMVLISLEFTPVNSDDLYIEAIQSLEAIRFLSIDLGATFEREKIIPIAPIRMRISYIINGVNVITEEYIESGTKTMDKNNPLLITVQEQFKNISELYKKNTNH